MEKRTAIEELESYIDDLGALKDGRIDIDSPEGQTLLRATIMVFEMLRDKADIEFARNRRQ